jgi:hypothetical protein
MTALVSAVAPSVDGGVIEPEFVVSAGSVPVRDVPVTAADPGAVARIGEGSEPDAATTEPRVSDVVVVVGSCAETPARSSAVLEAAVDDAADDVTTVPVEVMAEAAPLVRVLVAPV